MRDELIAVLGDRTTHGGQIISASGTGRYTIDGIPVACVGDRVICPQKGHTNCTIIQGDPNSTLDGKEIAYHGCVCSCGARVIAGRQTRSTLSVDYEGGGRRAATGATSNTAPAAQRGIQTADAAAGISPEVARMLAEQNKQEEDKDGFVAVFVNNNGRATGEHVSVFVGDLLNKDRLLYDPCGSYDKNKKEGELGTRGGDILTAEQFDYNSYYNYHREDGPDIQIFPFRVSKKEEGEIKARIMDPDLLNSCTMDCVVRTREVLSGIGPFKNLKRSGLFFRKTPKSLSEDMRAIKGGSQ